MKIIMTRPNSDDTFLFSLDNVPAAIPYPSVQALPLGFSNNRLVHLYVDEPIPDKITPHLDQTSQQYSELHTSTGRIAFGDIKLMQQPDEKHLARCNAIAKIQPGDYIATLHNTNFPEGWLENHIRKELGEEPKITTRLPPWIIWGCTAAFASLWFAGLQVPALLCAFTPFIGWRLLPQSKIYRQQEAARKHWSQKRKALEENIAPGLIIHLQNTSEADR